MMSFPDLAQLPPKLDSTLSLQLSQQAPKVFRTSAKSVLPWPISVLASNETQDLWISYENLLISLLRTGDDKGARECIDRLWERFGKTNERVMALTGMYEEAVAVDDKAIDRIIKDYEDLLRDEPTNMPIRKRHIALLRSTGKPYEAAARLAELVDVSPTDSEAWAELADLYLAQNMYSQAVYCLEEVLLIVPNAWNMQARLGEILFTSVASLDPLSDRKAALSTLSESLRRFCRSIELCDDYLRGYYGVKIASKRLLELSLTAGDSAPAADTTTALPSIAIIQRLEELATSKLAELSRNAASSRSLAGLDEAEVIAARALLDKDDAKTKR